MPESNSYVDSNFLEWYTLSGEFVGNEKDTYIPTSNVTLVAKYEEK